MQKKVMKKSHLSCRLKGPQIAREDVCGSLHAMSFAESHIGSFLLPNHPASYKLERQWLSLHMPGTSKILLDFVEIEVVVQK